MANSGGQFLISLQDIDDLLLLWLGWYAIEHDQALRTTQSGYAYSLELSGHSDVLLELLTPEHTLDDNASNMHGRIILRGPVELMDQAPAAILLPDALLSHPALQGERLVIAASAGSVIRGTGTETLAFQPDDVFTLIIEAILTGDRLHLHSLHHLQPPISLSSRSAEGRMSLLAPVPHLIHPISGLTAEPITAILFDGLGVFNAARVEALVAARLPANVPHQNCTACFHFQCRDVHEAEQLASLVELVAPDLHLAYSDDLILTDMDPHLDLPVLIAYLHVGQRASLFRKSSPAWLAKAPIIAFPSLP